MAVRTRHAASAGAAAYRAGRSGRTKHYDDPELVEQYLLGKTERERAQAPKEEPAAAASDETNVAPAAASPKASTSSRSQPKVNVRVQTPSATLRTPQVQVGGDGFWLAVGLGLVLLVIALATGHFQPGVLIALVFLVALAAVFPPAAVGLASIALLWMLLTHASDLFGRAQGLTSLTSWPAAPNAGTTANAAGNGATASSAPPGSGVQVLPNFQPNNPGGLLV